MCDCEQPDAMTKTVRRARISHTCCECGDAIAPGTQYEYVSGIWEGCALAFKTCLQCVGAKNYYVAECMPRGDCWPCFGEFWADATDHGNACTRADIIQGAAAAGYL